MEDGSADQNRSQFTHDGLYFREFGHKGLCHCEEDICSFRRSNLLVVLEIASGEKPERPRNDILLIEHLTDAAAFVCTADHFTQKRRD